MSDVKISPQGYRYGKDPLSDHPFWDEDTPIIGSYVQGVKGAKQTTFNDGFVNLALPDIVNVGDGLVYDPASVTLDVTPLTLNEVTTLTNLL